MKMSDVPIEAVSAKPAKIPTKMVETYDWATFYATVEREGFVVIEVNSDDIRTTNIGADEAAPIKAFNSWVKLHMKHYLKTKRIGANRWFIAL